MMYSPHESDENPNSPSTAVSEDKKINSPLIYADTSRHVNDETLRNVIQGEEGDQDKEKNEIVEVATTDSQIENEDPFAILNISQSGVNHMDIFNTSSSSSSEDEEDEDPELLSSNNNFLHTNSLIDSNTSAISESSKNHFSNNNHKNDSKFENDANKSEKDVKSNLDEPYQPLELSGLSDFSELELDSGSILNLKFPNSQDEGEEDDDEDDVDEIQLNSPSLYNFERENRFLRFSASSRRGTSSIYPLSSSYKYYTKSSEIDEQSQLSFLSDISAFQLDDTSDGNLQPSNLTNFVAGFEENSDTFSNPFQVFPHYDIFEEKSDKTNSNNDNNKNVPITKGYQSIDENRAIFLSRFQFGFHSMFGLLQKRLSDHIGTKKQTQSYFTKVFQYLNIYNSKAKNNNLALIILKCISILNMNDGTISRKFNMNPRFTLTERQFEFCSLEYSEYSDLLIDNTFYDVILENLQIGIKALFCILNFFELHKDLETSIEFKFAVEKFKKFIPVFFIGVYHTYHRINLKLIYLLNLTFETNFKLSTKNKKIRNLENRIEIEKKLFKKLNISKRYVEINQIELINKKLPFISSNCLSTDNLFFNQMKLLKLQPDLADPFTCNVFCACLPPFISYHEWRIFCSHVLLEYTRKTKEIDPADPKSLKKQAEEKLADIHLKTGSGGAFRRKLLKRNRTERSAALDILPDSEGILKDVGLRTISESIDDIIYCLKGKKSYCMEFGVKVAIINVTVSLLHCLGVINVSSTNQISLNPKFPKSIDRQIFDPIPLYNEVIRNEKVLEKFIKFAIPFIKELKLENSFEKEYEDMSTLISNDSYNTDILIKYLTLCKLWIISGLDKKIGDYFELEKLSIVKILKWESSFLQKYIKANIFTAQNPNGYTKISKVIDFANNKLKFRYFKYEVLLHYFQSFIFDVPAFPHQLKVGEIPFRLSFFQNQLNTLSVTFNSLLSTSCILKMVRMNFIEKFNNVDIGDRFYKETFTLCTKYFEKKINVSEMSGLFTKRLNSLREELDIKKDNKDFDKRSCYQMVAASLGIKSSKLRDREKLRETIKDTLIKIITAERFQYGKFFTKKLQTYKSYHAFKISESMEENARREVSSMKSLKRQLIVKEDIYKSLVKELYEICNLSYAIHPFYSINGKVASLLIF